MREHAMRAAVVTEFGGPDVIKIQDWPDPVPAAGQVLVEVLVADVIFVETAIRKGQQSKFFDVKPPYVPGGSLGGRVRAVGADVPGEWIGKTVVGPSHRLRRSRRAGADNCRSGRSAHRAGHRDRGRRLRRRLHRSHARGTGATDAGQGGADHRVRRRHGPAPALSWRARPARMSSRPPAGRGSSTSARHKAPTW